MSQSTFAFTEGNKHDDGPIMIENQRLQAEVVLSDIMI